ncbi:MAG: hypothetical protein LAN70_03755 [Acidobacteriia bacterium]|nr:hypothetical protein [Terriglobia bacterium]
MSGLRIAMAVLLASAASACAQEIPSGTALPVRLNTKLDEKSATSGQPITASIAQDVPLPSGGMIRAGSRMSGRVLQAGRKGDGSSYVRLRFDSVHSNGRDIAINTSLRALAPPRDVLDAQMPDHSPDRGESPANWTTTQIGGDSVYRGGGHVMHGDVVVGDPVNDGVMAVLLAVPYPGCDAGSNGRRLALWVFSSSACGAYGFGRFDIAHAGDTNPIGEIVLQSRKNVRVYAGSGMLLITVSSIQ